MIIGTRVIEQLDDNVSSTEILVSVQAIVALDAVNKISTEYPAWMPDIRKVPSRPSLTTTVLAVQ